MYSVQVLALNTDVAINSCQSNSDFNIYSIKQLSLCLVENLCL